MKKIPISNFLNLGDSLSDRGTADKRKVFGFIPMSVLSGLSKYSPRGRFTNGFLWADYVLTAAAEAFNLDALRAKKKLGHGAIDNADLADAFLVNEDNIRADNQSDFSLDDDMQITYQGARFSRFYCEGGLTAYDYSSMVAFDPTLEGSRLILSTLEKKREELIAYDEKNQVSAEEKSRTLVMEWSGANDLITVNERPTKSEALRAVEARIENLEILIAHGYRNFDLFNLPDLSLTPRFQRKSMSEAKNASECSIYFNQLLAQRLQALEEKYAKLIPEVSIRLFDVASIMQEVYSNPKEYGFDPDTLKSPYIESQEFKDNKKNQHYREKGVSPSQGFMFYDDVHPTEDLHDMLGQYYLNFAAQRFSFINPLMQEPSIIGKDLPYLDASISIPLPDSLRAIMNEIKDGAQRRINSGEPKRMEKGYLLLDLLMRLEKQGNALEAFSEELRKFIGNRENMIVLERHYWPFFDALRGKTTTDSEDLLSRLDQEVEQLLYELSSAEMKPA